VNAPHPHDWTRRRFVRGIGLGAFGLALPDFLVPRHAAATIKTGAKSCIFIFLFGGPSQLDTFDMKPDAPAEYRGEFRSVQTPVAGIRLCEHLPRTARQACHLALVRSLTMTGLSIGDHHADTYYVLTGRKPDRSFFVEGINRPPRPGDWPSIGSVVAWRRPQPKLPALVQLPTRSGEVTGYVNPGQFSGLLGPAHEAVVVRGELDKPRHLSAPAFELPSDVPAERLGGRRDLLKRVDVWRRSVEKTGDHDVHRRRALELLTSASARRAFDVGKEPAAVRDRYGDDVNGQSFLMARRLVEAGVPFVCVHWLGRRFGAGLSWDTHSDNFGQLKNVLLPAFDAAFSALLDDLSQRGLLDETLVVVAAEMGRTPRVGDPRTASKAAPGRDHWIHCQTALFAGGGIRGGQVYGSSDKVAGYPASDPVRPERIAATVYQAMGIPSRELIFTDRENRPHHLVEEYRPLPLFG
jgi:Protein of unknown function (DUF1501)